jgi:hypothetical protein
MGGGSHEADTRGDQGGICGSRVVGPGALLGHGGGWVAARQAHRGARQVTHRMEVEGGFLPFRCQARAHQA